MSLSVDPLRRQLRSQQQRFADVARREMESDLEEAAPVLTRELRDSIEASAASVTDAGVSFEVHTGNLIQAETTEHGARPHVIVPRNKRALAFTVGGTRVVVRRVNHPGNAPQPWFFPTVKRWPEIAARAWRRVSR